MPYYCDDSQFVKNHHLTVLDPQVFDTNEMHCLNAVIGFDVQSLYYGHMLLLVEYNDPETDKTRTFRVWFNIHQPNQGSRSCSNKMTDIQEIVSKTCKLPDGDTITLDIPEESSFGQMAFWTHTPLRYLEDHDDIALRKLQIHVARYSSKMQYCKYFRRHDKKRLAYENDHTIKI